MKRFFSKRQRMFIVNSDEWLCQLCGCELDESFHADHIVPFSKGGRTEVDNGQSLCSTCNSSKGDKMAIRGKEYREHQVTMIDEATEKYNNNNGSNFLAVIAPGGGKTIGALGFYDGIKTNKTKLIVVVPTKALVQQWHDEARDNFGLDLIKGFSYDNNGFRESDGFVITYAGVSAKEIDIAMLCDRYKISVVLDEAHHLSDSDTASWGVGTNNAFENAKFRLLLTGTPWKHNGTDILHVERDTDGMLKADFTFNKRQLLGKSLRWTQFMPTKVKKLEVVNTETGEVSSMSLDECKEVKNKQDIYGEVVTDRQLVKKMFKKADKKLKALRTHDIIKNAGGLIVCAETKHAHMVKDTIERLTGEVFPIVHSDMEKPHKTIKEFKNSNTRWIIAVDMIAEGIDIPRLQTVIFLSAKRTSLFVWQVVGRAERLQKEQTD